MSTPSSRATRATMILVVEAMGTCLSWSLPARYRPVSASMSAHDPASSFGAPGGVPFSWADARISRMDSAIRVAALLTSTILARTRCTPLLRPAGRRTSGPFSPYNDADGDDGGILHEWAVAYHLPGAIFLKNRCRSGGTALRLGRSVLLRREDEAWETVGSCPGKISRPCARSSWSANAPAAWTTTSTSCAAASGWA